MDKSAQTTQTIQPVPSTATATAQDITEFPAAEFSAVEFHAAKETVARYFETLAAEDFPATAELFSPDGTLYPPFESAVTGREAILTYLKAEARGLQLSPLDYTTEALEDDTVQCQVTGKVQTRLFGVNVGWMFVLNADSEIVSVRVKLLAALEELLKLKPEEP